MEEQPVEWEGVNNPKHRHMAVRCNGHKRNGERCQKPAMKGATVCRTHGGATRHVQRKARQRLEDASDRMAKQLLGIATDENVSPETRLKAIVNALDRGVGRAPATVEVSMGQQKPWEGLVTGLAPMTRGESRAARGVPDDPPRALERAEDDRPEIVEAEVVYDRPVGRPPWAEDASADTDRGNVSEPPQPGTGLMTMEEANAEIARRNRANSMHGTRISDIGR